MTKSIEQISLASKNYAEALIEIGEEGLVPFDKLSADLSDINDTFASSSELRNMLENPSFTDNAKAEVLESIFESNIDPHLINFLKILISKKRISEFGAIYADFINKLNEIKNIQPVIIVSAVELNDDYKNRIVQKLNEKLGKTVQPEWNVDENIIAGITVKIKDDVIDMSLKNRIDKLSKSLMLK